MSQGIGECSICYEGINDSTRRPRVLPCGHSICTMCIDNSIVIGDKSCPSCRQPHHVTSASMLPINYALEEVFQKLTMEACRTTGIDDEIIDDVRKKKENIISETRVSISSFESTVIELQNEFKMKENRRDNNHEKIKQKLAEVECLKIDIQEDNKAMQGIEGTINGLEEKIRFLENSVQNIQYSKTSADVLKIDENIKSKLKENIDSRLKTSTCQEEAKKNNALHSGRLVKLTKPRHGGLGLSIKPGYGIGAPIHIHSITPYYAADKHGGLKPDDRILSINGVSLEGKSVYDAANLVRDAVGDVTLEVKVEKFAGGNSFDHTKC